MNILTLSNKMSAPSKIKRDIDDANLCIENKREYDLSFRNIHILSQYEWQQLEDAIDNTVNILVTRRELLKETQNV